MTLLLSIVLCFFNRVFLLFIHTASIYTLEGFLLHVVRSSNRNVNITRIFNVSFNYDMLKKPVSYYLV